MAGYFTRVETIDIETYRTQFDKAISHTRWRGQIAIKAVMVPYFFGDQTLISAVARLLLLGQCVPVVVTDRQDTQ